MIPNFGTVECAVCGASAAKRSPRQVTCGTDACTGAYRKTASAAAYQRKKARRNASPTPAPATSRPILSPVAGALADVVLASRGRPHRRGRDAFMLHVKLLNDAVRTKDRDAYEDLLVRIGGWVIRELAAVRASGDASRL